MIFESNGSHLCSTSNCPSRTPTGPVALAAYRKVFDRIVDSPQLGTKVLQFPSSARVVEVIFDVLAPASVVAVGTWTCRGRLPGQRYRSFLGWGVNLRSEVVSRSTVY